MVKRVKCHRNSKRRTVALNTAARGAILTQASRRAAQCPDAPWVFFRGEGKRLHTASTGFAVACRRAGIKDFHFHDLRHTCAAWLVQAGVPLTQVRDVLGHASIVMTERYAHLAPENIRQAVACLDANEGSRHDVVTLEEQRTKAEARKVA